MKILLTKICNGKERFYFVSLSRNLFDEYVLERIYGNISNKTPTGKKINIFNSLNDSKNMFENIVKKKLKRFYKVSTRMINY